MPIHKIFVRNRDAPNKETVYLLEGNIDPEKFLPLFVNHITQEYSYSSMLKKNDGPIFEIRYKKAIIDPELNSLYVAASALGENNLEWGRIGKRFRFTEISYEEAKKIVENNLFNPTVQEIVYPEHGREVTGPDPPTLKPTGEPCPVETISLVKKWGDKSIKLSDVSLMGLSKYHSWNASLAQLRAIQNYEITRHGPFTDAELEIIVSAWSDHCYHTTWKGLGLLDRLKEATKKINHPRVISAYHDNAGGIDFGDDTVIILKGETHNHPTSIAPFGGVATKHGGVIRDVIGFGRGGYPIGGTTIMGTGLKETTPEGCLDPDRIVQESIEATAAYCNPMGIPILHAIYKKHKGYAKCLALGHSIGIIPKKYALKKEPQPGDIALLIGGRTGRDGIHGATASSGAAASYSKEKDFATVQIGDPITERKIMEATPHLRDSECIRYLTDLGAMGISGAAGESGAKTGIRLYLNKVLLKDTSLTAREILLSESQERMLLVIPPKKLRKAKRILRAYSVEHAAIGKFTDTKKFEVFWRSPASNRTGRGQKVVDIDMDFLWSECPIEALPVSEPKNQEWKTEADISPIDSGDTVAADALFQFDKTVQARTVVEPPGVSILAPTRAGRGIATYVSYHPEWSGLHPRTYVELVFKDAISRLIDAGADPKNIFLCSNFYTPSPSPQTNWHLREMVHRLAELTEEYGTPVITGKDSCSGTFIAKDGKEINVPPTFVLMAIGIVNDLRKVTSTCKKINFHKGAGPHIGVLYAAGTNCHEETMYALQEILGVKSTLAIINDNGDLSVPLKKFTGLIIPGGFSFGDHFGAGRVLSILIKQRLMDELNEFIAQKKSILGICNGFQVLMELGLLPGALARNASLRFESRWIKIASAYRGHGGAMDFKDKILHLPVAHAEGRIVFENSSTVNPAFYYVGDNMFRAAHYPDNPSGSAHSIAGLFAKSGHVIGMMPHPERAILPYHKSQDGLLILESFAKKCS